VAKTRVKGVKAKATRPPFVRFLKRAFVVLFLLVAVGVIFGMSFLMSNVKAVESLVDNMGDKIQQYNSKPSKIMSADGKVLYEIRPIYRENVSLNQIPKAMQQAIVAAEDKRYYDHDGVDYWGLARASVNMVKDRSPSGGGSTIPMQLAKRLFSASEVTMKRKIQDISIAIQMSKKFSKDEILEMYLNQVFYGEQAYGIAAAAEMYFDKPVEKLSIAECAMLARCVRQPSTENPVKNYAKADENKKIVLKLMFDEGMITEDQYEKAVKERPVVVKQEGAKGGRIRAAPYFTASVLRQLKEREIDLSQGGYLVNTTIDLNLQNTAEEAVKRVIRWNRGKGVNAGAFIACDSEGRVIVDVGGLNYRQNKYSRTTQSQMQPGSSFKAFIYAEALKEGVIGEYSNISNAKLKLPGKSAREPYVPRNSHGGYGGSPSLWSAFTQSINVPAVRTYQSLGFKHGAQVITDDFGFSSKLEPYAPLALGASVVRPIEMAEAYSVFMLDGKRVKPYSIKEVIAPDGQTIYQGGVSFTTTRIGPEVCRIMDKLFRGVVTSGTGKAAGVVDEAKGKTGTTNGGKAVWFCGYAKGIVGIAWAGSEYYDRRRNQWLDRPMPESFGGDVAAPIWAQVMQVAITKYGSDVKPDFGVQAADETERRRERRSRRDDEQENQTDEDRVQPIRDNEPDEEPDRGKKPNNNDTVPPLRDEDVATDPASNPDATNPGSGERDKPDSGKPLEKPKDKPKDKPRDKPKPSNDDDDVSVDVCADSGLLANSYCPETITRKYSKSRRPRSRCKLHKAPDEGSGGGQHQHR
jgi:penicillin-binding protein 1A